MSKKNKNRNRHKIPKTPKLGLFDEFIYTVAYSLSVLLSVALVFLCIGINKYVTYNFCSDAIAYSMSIWIGLLAVPCVTLLILFISPLNKAHELGISLYEALGFRPTRKTKQRSNDLKKFLLFFTAICFVLNITCLTIPFKQKTVLTKEADLIYYPIFGKEKIVCGNEMLSSIECEIYYRYSSYSSVGKYVFTTTLCYLTGERISFNSGDFKSFEEMIRFLERTKSDKRIVFHTSGAENILAYANERNLSADELQLLSKIFAEVYE